MQNALLLTQLIKAQIIQYGNNIICIFTDKLRGGIMHMKKQVCMQNFFKCTFKRLN